MSKPSVWNGRNESILGTGLNLAVAGAELTKTSHASPTSNDAKSSSQTPGQEDKKGQTIPITQTLKNVWNGKHEKIMEIRDKTAKVEDAPSVKSDQSHATKDQLKQQNIRVAVVSPPKDDLKSPLQTQNLQSKEDEGTNSTAGSSTTNMDEDATDEAPNVSSPANTSPKKEHPNASGSTSSQQSQVRGELAKSQSSRRTHSSETGTTPRRSSPPHGGSKGGRTNGNSSGNNSHAASARQNHSRGSNSGNGRRRANEKPICSFFMRGICNRGSSCAFKHDPAFSPVTGSGADVCITPLSSRNLRQNGSYTQKGSGASSAHGSNRFGAPRAFDPLKAKAIQLAKEAQDREDRSNFASPIRTYSQDIHNNSAGDPPFYSIDVECIATGYGSCAKGINDGCGNEGRNNGVPSNQYNESSHRYPGRVAMVDTDGNVVADIFIRPPHNGKGVVSYLTPLTGLTEDLCLGPDAVSLDEAVKVIKGLLPKNAVLVGQAINHDIEWLGLTSGGKDFGHMVDICEIFRQRIPMILSEAAEALKQQQENETQQSGSPGASGPTVVKESGQNDDDANFDMSSDTYLGYATRYRSFSLRHVCLNLLGEDIQSGVHDPIVDAKYSLALFHKYRNSSITELRIVRDGLHRAPITPGFATEKTPVIDGVCVSAAGYAYKHAARTIWKWYTGKKSKN